MDGETAGGNPECGDLITRMPVVATRVHRLSASVTVDFASCVTLAMGFLIAGWPAAGDDEVGASALFVGVSVLALSRAGSEIHNYRVSAVRLIPARSRRGWWIPRLALVAALLSIELLVVHQNALFVQGAGFLGLSIGSLYDLRAISKKQHQAGQTFFAEPASGPAALIGRHADLLMFDPAGPEHHERHAQPSTGAAYEQWQGLLLFAVGIALAVAAARLLARPLGIDGGLLAGGVGALWALTISRRKL